jgi:hypothetical protein
VEQFRTEVAVPDWQAEPNGQEADTAAEPGGDDPFSVPEPPNIAPEEETPPFPDQEPDRAIERPREIRPRDEGPSEDVIDRVIRTPLPRPRDPLPRRERVRDPEPDPFEGKPDY